MSALRFLSMDRSIFVVLGLVLACETRGAMYAGTDSTSANAPEPANDPPTTAIVGDPQKPQPVPPPIASSKPAPDASTGERAMPADCSLVCFNANANGARLSAADEARLASGLAETAHALEQCYPQKPTHTFQLRFNSAAALTGFGVDIDDQDGPACMIDIRSRMPAITMVGPSTIRCTEKCKR